jgi:hypothetical protein
LGWNLFGFVVDEAALGVETQTVDYVRELFLALNQRRRSRFGDLGFGGLFTSPGSEHGFVELIAEEGEGANARSNKILVRRTTTWEAKGELEPGSRVFLLDRDPDNIEILDTDLTWLGPGVCQRSTGEIVRYADLEQTDESPVRDHTRVA